MREWRLAPVSANHRACKCDASSDSLVRSSRGTVNPRPCPVIAGSSTGRGSFLLRSR